ncbi:hypothetical protein [Pseudoroseomonas cervicalis]|uniref:hypothetical protein n=1 Tax=Teichococcus cervicalis TaxID=204525 RepID=UPI0022F17448|nr:hypothetical protein [Pseudoroseomonas cervicalis]WBV45499.1 hypothetical protein PFY06_21715 [Pseudoroseomonas cervicalis]
MLFDMPPLDRLAQDAPGRAELRRRIEAHEVGVSRAVLPPALVARITEWLARIGRCSLPNYVPLRPGAPNAHRVNRWDERSFVKANYHQFSFLPWNQDPFDLFRLTAPVFRLRNLLAGLPPEKYLGRAPEEGAIARLLFHFYPAGEGCMNLHQDPVGPHQCAVPLMVLSRFGQDYSEGGLVLQEKGGALRGVDAALAPGDVVWFHPQQPHGIETIDPHRPADWLAFRGRWSGVFAVNKLQDAAGIADAADLGRAGSGGDG